MAVSSKKGSASQSRLILYWAISLFAVTWLLYSGALKNQFAFDDKSNIVENRFVREGASLKKIFTTNYRFGAGYAGDGLYRPIVVLSYRLNNFDVRPMPFHFVDISLNAINCVLFFLLLLILTESLPLASLSALVFAFHPIHTEVVANIAGRPELLCTFFLFSSWLLREKINNKKLYIPLMLISFFLALLSKETAAVFPFMIIITDWFRGRRLFSRNEMIDYLSLFSVLAVYVAIRYFVLGDTASGKIPTVMNNPIYNAVVLQRISTAFSVLTRYVILLFIPVRLSADYSYNQLPLYSSPLHLLPALGIIIFSAIIAGAIVFKKHSGIPGLALALFIFPYLIVSNLVFPIGTIMGERLMYLPSAGFALFTGYFLLLLYRKSKTALYVFMASILILYSLKTIARNNDWYDDLSIFTATAKTSPNSAKVYINLGFLWGQKGDKKTGEMYYRKALEIYPDSGDALSGLGKNLYDQRRLTESLECYKKAADIDKNDPKKHYDYGTVLEKAGLLVDAENEMKTAISLAPSIAVFYRGMGNVKITAADFNEAVRFFQEAMDRGDDIRINLNNIAYAWFCSGEYEKALKTVLDAESRGIRLHPDMVAAIREKSAQQ